MEIMICNKTFRESDFELFENSERYLVCGGSGSGKSYLVYSLIEKFSHKFDKILISGGNVSFYEKLSKDILAKIEFFNEIINPFKYIIQDGFRILYIMDDLQDSAFKSSDISKAYRTGRHYHLNLIIIAQTIFVRQPYFRDISLNVTGIILLKSRDLNSVEIFLRQTYGKYGSKKALSAYQKAMMRPYGHILFDLKITTPIELSVRSNILKTQFPYVIVYDIQ